MSSEKIMKICEQFIILKYAFHGAIEQLLPMTMEKELRDKMILYTKGELIRAGHEMLNKNAKKEAIKLYKETKE